MFENIKRFQSLAQGHILLLMALLGFFLLAQAGGPPICVAQGSCPEPAAYGYQPWPDELVHVFDRAGTNRLADEGPDLPQIWKGYPPSEAQLIAPYAPCVLLKGMGDTESYGWKQFNADYGQYGYTVISDDCGYGIMQITSGMEGGAGFEPSRVAAEPTYNIGTGARILIEKWNTRNVYIGNRDPHVVEDWYYAVWAYNYWGWVNNPNNNCLPTWFPGCGGFKADRPPFDGTQDRRWYPYQELVWGYASVNYTGSWLTLPPRESITDPPPEHIETPQPSHRSCSVVGVPDVKANYSGWNSIITIKYNDWLSPNAVARVTFYDSNGNELVTSTKTDLAAGGIWILDASTVVGNNFSGSAMVAANRDVSVVVQNRHSYMITAYDGISAVTGLTPDPGFACAAKTLHLPLIMRNYSLYGHTWNTTIYIQNAGTATANVYVYFYNQNGTSKDTDGPYTIQPGASVELNQVNDTELGSSFIGAAIITSNRPVAAIVNEVNTYSDRGMAYNAFSSGAKDIYLPLSFRNWLGLNSDIPVKNIGGANTYVTATYYEQGGSGTWSQTYLINKNALRIFSPPSGMEGKIGAAVARNNSSNLIALLHERREEPDQVQYMAYNGVARTASMTSCVSYVPILYRVKDSQGNWQWLSSIQAQNIESQLSNFVTAYFLDQGGDGVTWVGDWVQPNRSVTFYLPAIIDLPNNYVGSAVVEGHHQVSYPGENVNRKVVAIANVQNFYMVGDDWGGGYNGFNR